MPATIPRKRTPEELLQQAQADTAYYMAGEGRRSVRQHHAVRIAEQIRHERAYAGRRLA